MRALGEHYPFGPTAMAVALATRLDMHSHDSVARDAVLGIRCLTREHLAAQFLAQIACFLTPAAVLEVTYGAFRIQRDRQWQTVIGQLASHAEHSAPQVLGLVRDRAGSAEWQWAVDAYAGEMGISELDDLLSIAQASESAARVPAVLALAPYLPPDLRRRVLPAADAQTRMERVLLQGVAGLDQGRPGPSETLRAAFDDASSIRDRPQVEKTISVLAAKINASYGHEHATVHGSSELRTLTSKIASVSRPTALAYLAREADMLVSALGKQGVRTIHRDIREVSALLV
jgi:hypothetical protein